MRKSFQLFCRHGKVNLYELTKEDLSQKLISYGEKSNYRSSQILDWIYQKGITDFEQMKNLPISLRNLLKENISFGSYQIVKQQVSRDGTIKRALKFHDGQIIEAVMMPYDDGRRTVCISSQAGCAMGCVFCATGQMGYSRQLTSVEIFEQVAMYSAELQQKGERLSNIVFMGMVRKSLYDSFLSSSFTQTVGRAIEQLPKCVPSDRSHPIKIRNWGEAYYDQYCGNHSKD
jgi:adenine C2-methylase RlmN of 23S rRNA A2503 and tRNA A37